MMIFVTGGAGSGKSAFAEQLIVSSGCQTRCYLATMEVWDQEGVARVHRHRLQRADKNFQTFEYPKVSPLSPAIGGAVLVEDLTNLLMNQWFGVDKSTAVAQIVTWLDTLTKQSELVVVVANQITADGGIYDWEMTEFLQGLGILSRQLAHKSKKVYEVVGGIGTPLSPTRGGAGMTLIIGGAYQGKSAYAKALSQETGAPILDHLAQWLRTQSSPQAALDILTQRLEETPNLIILCDEVGCGVVPLDREERHWRERVGQVSTALALRANVVIRMVCGIPIMIKEHYE